MENTEESIEKYMIKVQDSSYVISASQSGIVEIANREALRTLSKVEIYKVVPWKSFEVPVEVKDMKVESSINE